MAKPHCSDAQPGAVSATKEHWPEFPPIARNPSNTRKDSLTLTSDNTQYSTVILRVREKAQMSLLSKEGPWEDPTASEVYEVNHRHGET